MNKSAFALSLGSLGYLIYLMMPSYYTTDMGNGITIDADKYVDSGDWVYHCKKMYLVSRTARVFSVEHFREYATTPIKHVSFRSKQKYDERYVIESVTEKQDWYTYLQYSDTGISEDSSMTNHYFWLMTEFNETPWVVTLAQPHSRINRHDYYITAEPYDPTTHRTHESALSEARTSCPTPQ